MQTGRGFGWEGLKVWMMEEGMSLCRYYYCILKKVMFDLFLF